MPRCPAPRGRREEPIISQFGGIYRGTIVNTADPLAQGRIQVSVPGVGAGIAWALPCRDLVTVPVMGQQPSPPPLGTGCWVMFEGGDASRPVCIGLT